MGKAKDMISTRLDQDSLYKLSVISESTHSNSRSEAVKVAIDLAYKGLISEKKNWAKAAMFSGYIGSGDSGYSDTSENYKEVLGCELDKKWS